MSSGIDDARGVEFRILGTVQALHRGSSLKLGGPRHRRLLAVLLLHAGEVVPTGRLTEALWGPAVPRSAQAMLHVRICELRAALRTGHPELLTSGGGYLLRVGPGQLDAWRFEQLVAAGVAALTSGDAGRARADLGAALALWRGPALAEFAHEPFARAKVARLAELRLQAIEYQVASDLAEGAHREVVADVRALVAEHPLRERFWAQLMLALYRSGRRAEALQAYQDVRRLLVDRLGTDPGTELRALHTAVLRYEAG
jgi:DNA-binding SARP family transcriptional activator